jgi:hypothetical protein
LPHLIFWELAHDLAPSHSNSMLSVVFTFTRDGNIADEATIPFTVDGGDDYVCTGVTSIDVTLTPMDNAVKDFHERATLAIPPLAGYSIANAVATAAIRAPQLAGDYDSDDLAVWTENFGEAIVPPTLPEVAMAALVAADEDAVAAATSTASTAENWFGQLSVDEAAIIALPAAESPAKRAERRHHVREEAFARTRRWSDDQFDAPRFQLAPHAASRSAEIVEQSDAEAFDDLASELAQKWREF